MSVTILHIDASGATCEVMLAVDGKPISHKLSDGGRDHAEKINLLVADTLNEARCMLSDLDGIAVCNGPGSYTGLRIGLATAKGFCYALGKPLILHNRLKLMLCDLMRQQEDKGANMLAILPARAGEYYIAAAGEYSSPPVHISTELLLANLSHIQKPLMLIGQHDADIALTQPATSVPFFLNMNLWAGLTLESFFAKEFANLAYAEPEYLKPAYITASRTDR